jgi:hypothetical protein
MVYRMSRLLPLFRASAVAFTITGFTTGAAAAVELPELVTQTNATGTTGADKINLTGGGIRSASGTFTWTFTSKQGGTFSSVLQKSALGGEECHSLGDAAELILARGSFRIVRLKSGSAGVLLTYNPIHVECKFAATLELQQGSILVEITPVLTPATNYRLVLNVISGKQELTQYEDDAGTKASVTFEGSINGGIFKSATLESANNELTTVASTEIVKTT